ncbi:MAG: ParA family protein [Candidatus Aminicenantes bacterium]|nr:ParA family protein [Candidatus Aminicenantes bacterium]
MEPKKPRIVAIANQKGGVGKTTTAINLSAALTRLGKQILLIDIDSGSHATYGLGILAHKLEKTVYNLLKGEVSLEEAIIEVLIEDFSMDFIPSSLELAEAEMILFNTPGREFLLSNALSSATKYDFIFIDCPPSLGLLTLNALVAAREIFIPLQTEFLALQGLSKLLDSIAIIKERLNPQLELMGVCATRYDGRKILNREVVQKIRTYFGDKAYTLPIRENISLAESPSHGLTIFEYSPSSYGAEDYMILAKDILERSGQCVQQED